LAFSRWRRVIGFGHVLGSNDIEVSGERKRVRCNEGWCVAWLIYETAGCRLEWAVPSRLGGVVPPPNVAAKNDAMYSPFMRKPRRLGHDQKCGELRLDVRANVCRNSYCGPIDRV
jgi:hypothetical protein